MAAALLPPVLLSCRLSRRSGSSAGEGAVDREDLEPGEELLDVPVFQRGPTDDVTVRLTGASPMPTASRSPATWCRSADTSGTAFQKVVVLRAAMRARVMLATAPL